MRRLAIPASTLLILAAAARAQPVPASQPAGQADIPVRRVQLFSSGVGYFEHDGTVAGDGTAELDFKADQINDVLKSLVLQDEGGGKVSAVSFPSQDPLDKTLKSFGVDIGTNPPIATLLNQLRGTQATITVAGEKVSGTVLGAEVHNVSLAPNAEPVPVWSVNLVSSGGTIRQIELPRITELTLDDPKLQADLGRALAAVAGARNQDKKPVRITFTGSGERHVRIGYVTETPVWKTSYRLLLPATPPPGSIEDAAFRPTIQGWAIVENQTDSDWSNVQLSLVSGRPISFVQDLYTPLYMQRPVVRPDLFASLQPQQYAGGMVANGQNVMSQRMAVAAVPAAKAADDLASTTSPRFTHGPALELAMPSGGNADTPMDAAASIAAAGSAVKLGDLFQYDIGNVSLPRQSSAMLPIVADAVQIDRLSIFNLTVLPKNPLTGVRLTNTTGKHLLAGPVTVLNAGSYAGDARIDNLPPGQQRLLSYGIDLDVQVNADTRADESWLVGAKIVNGSLIVSRQHRLTQDYLADNKTGVEKQLLIEQAISPGFKLTDDTAKPVETTDTLYRFQFALPPGKPTMFEVKQQQVEQQWIGLLGDDDLDGLAFYSNAKEIPADVQKAVAKAIDLKRQIVDTQHQLEQTVAKLKDITDGQDRIRRNLDTPNTSSQYKSRLAEELDQQETLIKDLQTQRDSLQQQLTQQRKAMTDYLTNLNVG